jgi:hypothetical protein
MGFLSSQGWDNGPDAENGTDLMADAAEWVCSHGGRHGQLHI